MSLQKIPSSRASQRVRYAIRDVVVLAQQLEAQGREMLYLNIGDPNRFDFDLVEQAVEAITHALRTGQCGYAPSLGLPHALEAITEDAARKGSRNIIGAFCANGASEAIDICLTALLNQGDNVLIPSPTYPLYSAVISRLGAEVRRYPLVEADGWQPDMAKMADLIDERTRAIVVINPNNPTGMIYSEASLRAIIKLAKEHGLLLLNDEIYDELRFEEGRNYIHLPSLDPEASVVTFNGLSKVFFGPGIRMGWGVVTGLAENLGDYYEGVQRLLRARLSASRPVQFAIEPCLRGNRSHLPIVLEKIRYRRDLALDMIRQTPGLSCVTPAGAFYGFVRIEHCSDDVAWCRDLMQKTGVVVVPGSGFDYTDPDPDVGHFRFVYLAQEDVIRTAFEKILAFMRDHDHGSR